LVRSSLTKLQVKGSSTVGSHHEIDDGAEASVAK